MYDGIEPGDKTLLVGLVYYLDEYRGPGHDFVPSSNKNEELFSALMKCNIRMNFLYLAEENSVEQLQARIFVTARSSGTRTRMTPDDTASISNGVSGWTHSKSLIG